MFMLWIVINVNFKVYSKLFIVSCFYIYVYIDMTLIISRLIKKC